MIQGELHVGGVNGRLKKRDRLIVFGSYLTLGIIIIALAVFTIMNFFPFKVLEVHNHPIPVLNEGKTVAHGETVNILFNFTKYTPARVESIRSMICGDNLVTLSPVYSNMDTGHQELVVPYVDIPHKAGGGECYLDIKVILYVNPFRTVTMHLETEPFMVQEEVHE